MNLRLEETTAGPCLNFYKMAQHVSVTEGRAAQVKTQATTQERLTNYSKLLLFSVTAYHKDLFFLSLLIIYKAHWW
jgi:hypothetical protein